LRSIPIACYCSITRLELEFLSSLNFGHFIITFGINAERFLDHGQDYPAFFQFFDEFEDTRDPLSGSHLYFSGQYKTWSVKAGQHKRLSNDFVSASQGNGINKLDTQSRFYQLAYFHELSDQVDVHLALEEVNSQQSTVLVQLPANVAAGFWSNGAVVPFIGGNYRDVSSGRVTLDSTWRQNDNSQWQMGVEYRREENQEITFQGNWDPDINRESNGFTFIPKSGPYTRELWWFGNYQPLVPASERKVKSLYLQNKMQWHEQWQLTLEARYDYYDDVGSNLSFRGGLVYQYSAFSAFKLLYGQAFRAPTLFELNALIATGLIGNPDLAPETVDTFDLVYLKDWGKAQMSLTYYHSRFDDVIETVAVEDILSGFASFQPQNVGSMDLSGWELDLKAQLSSAFSVRISHASANEYVKLAAADTLSSVSVNYVWENLNINLSGVFHAQVLSRQGSSAEEAIHLGNYWLIKVHANYMLSPTLDLSLTVNNLFDEEYTSYNTANGLERGTANRGRHWQLSLTQKF